MSQCPRIIDLEYSGIIRFNPDTRRIEMANGAPIICRMNESIAVAAERQQPPVLHFISIGKAVQNYYNQIGNVSDPDDADDKDDQESTYQAMKDDESYSPSDEDNYAVYALRPDESDRSQDKYSEQYIQVMPAEISTKKNSAA